MFFDDAGAQRHGGEGNLDAEGVIGIADGDAECLGEQGHDAQVAVGGIGGIVAHALEQRQLPVAFAMNGGDGGFDFAQRGHTGGHDHRLALAGDMRKQRQVGEFSGRNLECGHSQLVQQIGTGLIEGRGQEQDAASGAWSQRVWWSRAESSSRRSMACCVSAAPVCLIW